MPFKITAFYANLIAKQKEPARTQLINIVVPPAGVKPFIGRFDPYGNKIYREKHLAYIQHKYATTVLFHLNNYCISNCQFCYKVNEIRLEKQCVISSREKINNICEYIKMHPEVNNILFTGGDPMTCKIDKLIEIIDRLISLENIRVFRLATKCLAFYPEKFLSKELLQYFHAVNKRKNKQITVVAQINHPAEIDVIAERALQALHKVGVQVRGQPAIIKGVNDTSEVLVGLLRKYLDNKIIPYYLTLFMPVKGVEQYALPLHECFKLVADAKSQLSGLEKKAMLVASHDFGKFELCGFLPSNNNPQKIILKWHQAAMSRYLPEKLIKTVATSCESLLCLDYAPNMYCLDQIFNANGIPYYDIDGNLVIN